MTPSAGQQRRLLRAIASGDQAAFSGLYDILAVATYTVFRHYLPRQSDADQAMKAMWLYVWQNARTLSHRTEIPSELIVAAAESQAQLRAGAAV